MGLIEDTPPLVRTLLERVAEHLALTDGTQRLEVIFENGRMRSWYFHGGPYGPDAAERRRGETASA